MVEEAAEMDDPEIKKAFINYIASFMVNSSRNWNDENLDKATVIDHLSTLSKGNLQLTEDDLEIHIDSYRSRSKNKNKKNPKNKQNRNRNRKRR